MTTGAALYLRPDSVKCNFHTYPWPQDTKSQQMAVRMWQWMANSVGAPAARRVSTRSIWALIPAQVSDGQGLHTLLTSMFLHGGLLHLGGNMLFLWVFGNCVNAKLGNAKYLLLYITCGLFGGIIQGISSSIPGLGASGAINGVIGMYLVMFASNSINCFYLFFETGVRNIYHME